MPSRPMEFKNQENIAQSCKEIVGPLDVGDQECKLKPEDMFVCFPQLCYADQGCPNSTLALL